MMMVLEGGGGGGGDRAAGDGGLGVRLYCGGGAQGVSEAEVSVPAGAGGIPGAAAVGWDAGGSRT